MTKKPNLLSRIRKISIERPEDFAANHDLYIRYKWRKANTEYSIANNLSWH